MSYFRPCPICGANLDPGERCDCNKNTAHGVAAPRTARISRKANHNMVIIPERRRPVNAIYT